MICKIITFPFWVISRILGSFVGVLKLAVSLVGAVIVFLFNHVLGTVFGALIGLILGRKHIGIKLFSGKKKAAKVKK